MERKKMTIYMMAVVCVAVLTSCLITTLDTVWKDPQHQGGTLNKILVIGIARNQTIRRVFEDDFVAKLGTYGVDAISSYRILPTEEMLDKNTIESKIQTLNIDAVLLTRLVDKKKETEYRSYGNRRYDWHGWYSRSYSYANTSVSYKEYEVLKIETNVYDTKTGEMIWSALSDTVAGGSNEVEIKSLIKVITKSLSDSELI
jgi:hypothetical protein